MMTIEECRQFYAREVAFSANLTTPGLVDAFAKVPREKFLGPGPWYLGSASARSLSLAGLAQMSYITVDDARDVYHNVVIVLDREKDINNGQPGSLACWIDALSLKPGDSVYHLGCGVGYYTAIIAETVGSSGRVVGLEYHPELAARAKANLEGYVNVRVEAGDGLYFDPGDRDAMLVNCGVTHPLTIWLDRLRDGGRLVLPITMAASATLGQGLMIKVVRTGAAFPAELVSPVGIYSGVSMRDAALEPQLLQALKSGGLLKARSVRRDAHEKSETCVVHRTDVCLSLAGAT